MIQAQFRAHQKLQQREAAYSVRSLRVPKWPNGAILLLMIGSFGLVGLWPDSDLPAYLFCLVPILVLWHYLYLNRCPECRRKLEMRAEPIGIEKRQIYFDCPNCRISWDPEWIDSGP